MLNLEKEWEPLLQDCPQKQRSERRPLAEEIAAYYSPATTLSASDLCRSQ